MPDYDRFSKIEIPLKTRLGRVVHFFPKFLLTLLVYVITLCVTLSLFSKLHQSPFLNLIGGLIVSLLLFFALPFSYVLGICTGNFSVLEQVYDITPYATTQLRITLGTTLISSFLTRLLIKIVWRKELHFVINIITAVVFTALIYLITYFWFIKFFIPGLSGGHLLILFLAFIPYCLISMWQFKRR